MVRDMQRNWLPWVLPMGLFILANVVEGKVSPSIYPVLYIGKILVVTLAAVWASRAWRADLRLGPASMGVGLVSGLIGLALWLAIDLIPYPRLGERTGFDPFRQITDSGLRSVFLATRFFGLALLVPVIEEVFWRGFGLRFAADQDKWSDLAHGSTGLVPALIVSGVFAFAHPEWLAALVYGLGLALLLRKTGNLGACLVAHVVTNLLLGLWVVSRGAWHLW